MSNPSEKALFDALAALKFLKGEGLQSGSKYHCVVFPVVEFVETNVPSDETRTVNFLEYGANFGFNVDGVDIDAIIEMLEKLVNFQLNGGNLDIFLEMISKFPTEPPKHELEYSDWHTIYYDENGNVIREEKYP